MVPLKMVDLKSPGLEGPELIGAGVVQPDILPEEEHGRGRSHGDSDDPGGPCCGAAGIPRSGQGLPIRDLSE